MIKKFIYYFIFLLLLLFVSEKTSAETLSGQTILKGSLTEKQYLDLKNLIKGSYIVRLV